MAFSAKTNQLTGPGATGNSSSTDPGFQPTALLIWNGLQTTAGASADAQFNLGVASSTTTETAAGYNSDDNVASSDVVRVFNTARLIATTTAGTVTNNLVADLTSFDALGFTKNWSTLGTANPLYNYLALGGSDITNVKTGNFAAATSGATQAVTGVGFQPDIVFLFGNLQATSAASNNNNQYSVGVMTPTAQWAVGNRSQNSQATMNTTRSFATNRAFSLVASASNTEFDGRSFASMDSDGFTLNIDTQGGTGVLIGYLAIKGGQWKVGTETQRTSTGTKATTGVGFQPSGVIFAGNCDTATGITDHARLFFGAATGTSNNTCVWTGDTDNVADSIANTIMSSNKCVVMATEGTSASPTTNAEAALSSFDADGFTLDYTTADATARLFGYVAFGGEGALDTGQGTTSVAFHPGRGPSNVGRFYQPARDNATHTVPNAPTALSVAADNEYRTVLNWTASIPVADPVSSYRIERSLTSGSGFSEIASIAAGVTYYIDLTASANTTYYYRVRAHNYYGDSVYSSEATTTTLNNGSAWSAKIQGWLYPSAVYSPIADFADGRTLDTLKPEYFTVNASGVITQLDAPASGTYGFSPPNKFAVKSYSKRQFITVSSGYANFNTLMESPANQSAGITTLVDFCTTHGFTGIELDWEGYSSWTDTDYSTFKTFLGDLATALHAEGKQLMVDGPPIGDPTVYTGIAQSFYEFKYEEIAPLVDYITVLAYDNQYDYGGGAAVQPTDWLQTILRWVIDKVGWANRSKIVVGMPSYGYHATTDDFDIVIDTYRDSQGYTGFSTATRDAGSNEMMFTNAGNSYVFQDVPSLNAKRKTIEDMGIVNVSVWHLGGNLWFNGRQEPEVDTLHIGAVGTSLHPGATPNRLARFFRSLRSTEVAVGGPTAHMVNVDDSITLTDSLAKAFGKVTVETITLSDAQAKTFGKAISDSVTLSDTTVKSVGKAQADSITLTDATTKSTDKAVSDSVTLSDSTAMALGKVIADSLSVSDSLAKSTAKSVSDDITLVDSVAKAVGKVFADALTLDDAQAKAVSKALVDSVVLTDNTAKQVFKAVADSVSLADSVSKGMVIVVSDSLSLTDAVVKNVQKSVADGLTLTESLAKAVSKVVADSITVTDAATTNLGSTVVPGKVTVLVARSNVSRLKTRPNVTILRFRNQ